MTQPVTFIARETRYNLHGINAVLGSIEKYTDPELCHTVFSGYPEELIRISERAFSQNRLPVIAWSFHSVEVNIVQKDLTFIKKRLSHIDARYIAGGAHASACPESVLAMGFDFVFCGEGESLIIDFIGRLIEQDDTLTHKRIFRASQDNYLNLDLYPAIPERSLKLNPVEITRGCIYGCAFCQTSYLFGRIFRYRSEEEIMKYAELLIRRGGHFLRMTTPSALSYGSSDDQPCLEKVESLLKRLRAVMGPERKIYFGTFPSEIRPEHLSRDALQMLKRHVDNNNIIIGIQSGSEKLLKLCGRSADSDTAVRSVEASITSGFRVNADFIFGLPGEDQYDRSVTLRMIRYLAKLGVKIHAHWFTPLPGTPLHNRLPAEPDPILIKELNRFMSEGILYGHWRKQMRGSVRTSEPR